MLPGHPLVPVVQRRARPRIPARWPSSQCSTAQPRGSGRTPLAPAATPHPRIPVLRPRIPMLLPHIPMLPAHPLVPVVQRRTRPRIPARWPSSQCSTAQPRGSGRTPLAPAATPHPRIPVLRPRIPMLLPHIPMLPGHPLVPVVQRRARPRIPARWPRGRCSTAQPRGSGRTPLAPAATPTRASPCSGRASRCSCRTYPCSPGIPSFRSSSAVLGRGSPHAGRAASAPPPNPGAPVARPSLRPQHLTRTSPCSSRERRAPPRTPTSDRPRVAVWARRPVARRVFPSAHPRALAAPPDDPAAHSHAPPRIPSFGRPAPCSAADPRALPAQPVSPTRAPGKHPGSSHRPLIPALVPRAGRGRRDHASREII